MTSRDGPRVHRNATLSANALPAPVRGRTEIDRGTRQGHAARAARGALHRRQDLAMLTVTVQQYSTAFARSYVPVLKVGSDGANSI
ncbi:hypothetical protein [Frankia sp. R82]|uniref:hypothetical protein n=1 Tax=Frankia sp. R82 TaxID=2950553 RepID=UPI002044C04A|nr:hypothetical protein [Frankia sp. R82]MCM3886698.1 hypothetical protein [Frankia sp. R82]